MKIHCTGITDKGIQRSANQDFYFVQETPFITNENNSFLFILADGMGGHAAGEVASRLAVTTAKHFILNAKITASSENIDSIITGAIEEANETVWTLGQEKEGCEGMGTTLIIGIIVEDILYLGNVGDSRGYTMRGNTLTQETRDHSLVAEQVRLGIITKDQAFKHPCRHLINRAVGVREFVKSDIFKVKLQPNDVILLCSDGLVDYVPEDDFQPSLMKDTEMEIQAKELVDLANKGGGGDNITAILVKVLEEKGTNNGSGANK
ncbi:Stp1/IreP family PP2C-type Ser/Thr phosphatase [Candidatus Riflebacteria bacterium]